MLFAPFEFNDPELASIKHYVTLSIAGIDQMLGVDYMYGKKIQEATSNAVISKPGFQTIAANDVAGIVARFVIGEPLNGIMEITRPERKQMSDIRKVGHFFFELFSRISRMRAAVSSA